jgi:hypothetical protein
VGGGRQDKGREGLRCASLFEASIHFVCSWKQCCSSGNVTRELQQVRHLVALLLPLAMCCVEASHTPVLQAIV